MHLESLNSVFRCKEKGTFTVVKNREDTKRYWNRRKEGNVITVYFRRIRSREDQISL